jgi:hypothetical protein
VEIWIVVTNRPVVTLEMADINWIEAHLNGTRVNQRSLAERELSKFTYDCRKESNICFGQLSTNQVVFPFQKLLQPVQGTEQWRQV